MSEVQKIAMGFTPKPSLKPGQVLEMHFPDGSVQRYQLLSSCVGYGLDVRDFGAVGDSGSEEIKIAIDPWADGVRREELAMRNTQRKACGKQDKASAKARRANVFGVQHYAGKPFVSYAYADKLRRL